MFDFLRNLTQSAEEKRQEQITMYLDGALSSADRARFEAMLGEDPALQADLGRERLLQEALRQLPQRRTPRNFTLDPALYGRPTKQPLIQLYPVLRAATGLTAVFLIFALFATIYLNNGGTESLASAPMAESVALAVTAEGDNDATGEEIVVTRIVSEIVVAEAEEGDAEMAEAAPVAEEAMEEEGFADELDASASADTTMEEAEAMDDAAASAGEALPTETATSTSTLTPTPTMAATATVSQLPRATATAVLADRSVDVPTDEGANLAPDEEPATLETAVPPPNERTSNAPLPNDPYSILFISLFLLFLILGTITLYTKRQL